MQPDRILHYKIESHLGSGSFGDVYQAYDEKLKRYVAIKIAAPNEDEDIQKELAARFELEIGATIKLVHPNIVTVYDAGTTDEFLFYVMANLTGGDLKKNNNKIVSNAAIAQVCIDVTKALAYAHDMGFIHRDIKPENILFDAHGNAVVADFGIVKAMGEDYTIGHLVMGTPSYSAPEQLDANEEIDGRADLYSLGKVLHFMLTKRKYESSGGDALPPERAMFCFVLNKLLSTDRNDRFKNAHEALASFEALLSEIKQSETDDTVVKTMTGKSTMDKNIYRIIAAIVLAVVIGATAFAFLKGMPGDKDQPNIQVVNSEKFAPNNNDNIANKPIAVATDAILSITTEPSGANVLLNGEILGTTPFISETMPVGQQTFTLKKRFFKEQSMSLILESKKIVKKSVFLETGSGGLSIITEPVGAQVWIGGKPIVGDTPLSIDGVKAGPQTIDIRKGNFSLRREIEIEHSQVTVMRATLDENTGQTDIAVLPSLDSGMISLNSNPPGADVFIDGDKVGTTPFQSDRIEAGIHDVKLSHKFYVDVEFDTTVSAEAPVKRFVELKRGSGSLSVLTDHEGATVRVDNKLIKGVTPLSLNKVITGRHSIDIRKGELRLVQDIEIYTDTPAVVDGKLEAGTLIAIDTYWLTADELMAAAKASKKAFVKIKIYQAILTAQADHKDARAEMEKFKDSFFVELERLKNEHDYKEARKIADFISENFGAYFELPDIKVAIDTHENNFKNNQVKTAFEKEDKKIRSLIKINHFDEARTLITKLPAHFRSLDEYNALNKYVEDRKIDFQQRVLKLTGPLPLIQVSNKDYLRAFAYEVTFNQWDNCFNEGLCARKPDDFGWGRGNRPVVDVSFEEITAEFIPWINQKTGIKFKLPTEAEWKSLYGKSTNVTNRHANGPEGFGWGNDSAIYTAKVGSYIKNANGIYDLNGNVWEWVDECGESSCVRRTLKGGSWNSAPKFFSSVEKWLEFPAKRANDIGFRLVASYTWQL